MNAFSRCLLVGLLLLSCPFEPAIAREPTPSDRASALVRSGKSLVARHRYSEALEAFSTARSLADSGEVVWSIARCHELLGDYVRAMEVFEEFLAMDVPEEARDKARKRLRSLNARVGYVRILVEPEGASLSIDGRMVGLAPLSHDLRILPGSHVVRAEKNGCSPAAQTVVVAGGGVSSVALRLIPLPTPQTRASGPATAPVSTEAIRPVATPSTPATEGGVVQSAAPRRWSPLKTSLFFSGIGLALVGGGLQLGAWRSYASVDDARHSWAQKNAAADTSERLYYAGYGMYGAAAIAVVLSFVLPSAGRHPLSVTVAPQEHGALGVASIVW